MSVVLVVVGLFLGVASAAEQKLVLDGSSTVGPIAKALAEYYMAKHPGVKVAVSESDSGNGVKGLIDGACDIANMSRFVKENEFAAAFRAPVGKAVFFPVLDDWRKYSVDPEVRRLAKQLSRSRR